MGTFILKLNSCWELYILTPIHCRGVQMNFTFTMSSFPRANRRSDNVKNALHFACLAWCLIKRRTALSFISFEVFLRSIFEVVVSWVLAPYSFVGGFWLYERTCCLHPRGLRNILSSDVQIYFYIDSNPGGGEIFSTRLERPWGLHRLLYSGYLVISGVKAIGAWP
jgi:hypothetical protein